jgi:hypothetical protein
VNASEPELAVRMGEVVAVGPPAVVVVTKAVVVVAGEDVVVVVAGVFTGPIVCSKARAVSSELAKPSHM